MVYRGLPRDLGMTLSCGRKQNMQWYILTLLYYGNFHNWLSNLLFNFLQNLREGFKPKIKRMQNLAAPKTIHISESGVGLLTHNSSEYEMGRLHRPESFVTPHNLEP